MSIDDLARAAAADARHHAERTVAPGAMLVQLHRTKRRHNVLSVAAVLTIGALVLVGGGALFAHNPIGTSVSTPAESPPADQNPCSDPAIRCLPGHKYRVALAVPVTVTVPDNFAGAFNLFGTRALEDYRNDVDTTGVTVLEDAIPVTYDASWSRDPAAGTTAESMANWLTHRAFLVHTTMIRTTIGGRTAWRVTADLKPRATLPAEKAGGSVAPTFMGGLVTEGFSQTLTGEYTLLDVPGAGVTVIWSWSLNNSIQATAANRAYVEGLTFG